MSNDYELLEKLHCLVQEVEMSINDTGRVMEIDNDDIAEMYEIIEHLREKNPQAPWNNETERMNDE